MAKNSIKKKISTITLALGIALTSFGTTANADEKETIYNRIAGKDRYHTSNNISSKVDAKTLILANGTNYADALSASALVKKENGAIYLTNGKNFDSYKLKTKIKGNLGQIRITPKGSNYLPEVVYSIDISGEDIESKNICGIDIGANNLATLTNKIGKNPIVINGKVLKSINQYYNKR